jgi:tRNA(His) 5'-end guanylyltransferase
MTAENWAFLYLNRNLRGQKSLGPLKMSLEMAHKVIVPQKKNYVPQFLKQRDINSYSNIVYNVYYYM